MVKYFHFHIPDLDIWYDAPLESTQCIDHNKNGTRCKRKVIIGAPYCSQHLKLKHFLVIQDSTIENAGIGLYACDINKDEDAIIFKKNDRVCYYDGEVLTQDQFIERYRTPPNKKTVPYTFALHNNEYEDGAIKRGVGTLVNHKPANQCNCKLSIGRNNRAQIIAIKDITNYSELFVSYSRSYRMLQEGVETSTNGRKYNA